MKKSANTRWKSDWGNTWWQPIKLAKINQFVLNSSTSCHEKTIIKMCLFYRLNTNSWEKVKQFLRAILKLFIVRQVIRKGAELTYCNRYNKDYKILSYCPRSFVNDSCHSFSIEKAKCNLRVSKRPNDSCTMLKLENEKIYYSNGFFIDNWLHGNCKTYLYHSSRVFFLKKNLLLQC